MTHSSLYKGEGKPKGDHDTAQYGLLCTIY